MYLKELKLKNYRKINSIEQTINFAHCENNFISDSETLEKYLSQGTTLLVGKNNTGKSTIINLLNKLSGTKSGKRCVFKYSDFNLDYIKQWYDEHLVNANVDDINTMNNDDFPTINFEITIGIDAESDNIGNLADVILIESFDLDDNTNEINIDIRYEVVEIFEFKKELIDIINNEIIVPEKELNFISGDAINELKVDNQITLSKLTSFYVENYKTESDVDAGEIKSKIEIILNFYNELKYTKFLNLLSSELFCLNFYPEGSSEVATDFKLASILNVKTIDANTVTSSEALSKSYNQIVNTFLKNKRFDKVEDLITQLNLNLNVTVNESISKALQNTIQNIENPSRLKVNLRPNITEEKIFSQSILYEYVENGRRIPENQFGMGYTNLMVIIANIIDYLEVYKDINSFSAMNILCIEEPETYMHPQMQEIFIKNISKVISSIYSDSNVKGSFQIIITTHSPHILNSKIQSGDTLNNIVYHGLTDDDSLRIVTIEDKKLESKIKDIEINTYRFIKKYISLELTDIFFADAIIIVEGMTEELYLRYLIDNNLELNKYHIQVYKINGAHANKFFPLFKLIGIKTFIITDLDLKRENIISEENSSTEDAEKKKSRANIESLPNASINEISTNTTLIEVINNHSDKIQSNVTNIFDFNSLTIFTQGKINGYFATSFEEALILTNSIDSVYKSNLIKLLKIVRPNKAKDFDSETNIASMSYDFQASLKEKKEEFITTLIFQLISNKEFRIETPSYINEVLNQLKETLGGTK